eukprot:CAMPEP_0176004100 /NCGR_PEP_ID=MMETSP0120_2-20121206/1517_1 /TAXON_ID=160619 /ORGANISM="Kryptoperidinium foliaceum, Strain CCMP 1326" /LENGTH=411 /DNA_ID=CAMNT_0017336767 /DNA_START=264 /DNA_END=1497 /DNA_ORIENTATION=+
MSRRDVMRLMLAVFAANQANVLGFAFHQPLLARQLASSSPISDAPILKQPSNHYRRLTRCYASSDRDVVTNAEKKKVESSAIQSDDDARRAYQELEDELEEEEDYLVAVKRTAVWVAAAVAFGGALSYFDSPTTGEEFFAGYLLEQSLSVDNLLVFLLLFEYFRIPTAYQNRILNWGILGAIGMRAIMIGAGAVAIKQFHAILLVFAAILIYSSGKVLIGDDEEEFVVKFSNRLFKSTSKFDGDRFFTEVNGERLATPMFLCMVAVELSDVIFAVDSIPAVFGVTENPLVVFTSNMFAIMGLRSLYTILSKAASELKYLEPAVAIILGFIGSKMILEYFGVEVPTEFSLSIVATLLAGGIGASLIEQKDEIVSQLESSDSPSDAYLQVPFLLLPPPYHFPSPRAKSDCSAT